MKTNTDKSHLLLSGSKKVTANIGGNVIESEHKQILLDITIDSNRSINKYIKNLCKKANAKLNALARMKSFITSQFEYCPLMWMFHSRALNNKINLICERALIIRHRNLKSLATEIF